MGSSMSILPTTNSMFAFLRNKFGKKRSSSPSDEDDYSSGPSSSKQRRFHNLYGMSSSGGTTHHDAMTGGHIKPSASDSVLHGQHHQPGFLATKSSTHSMRKTKHTLNGPSAASLQANAAAAAAAPGLYPFTNGHHHQAVARNFGSRVQCGSGARSPPPQLLPAGRSRFSRVPPGLLPIGGGGGRQNSGGGTTTILSSYGLVDGGNAATNAQRSVVAVNYRRPPISSTPKYKGSLPAPPASVVDVCLRRAALAEAASLRDYSVINGSAETAAASGGAQKTTGGVRSQIGGTRSIASLNAIPTSLEGYAALLRRSEEAANMYANVTARNPVAYVTPSLIDLCNEESVLDASNASGLTLGALRISEPETLKLPPVNRAQSMLETKPVCRANFLEDLTKRYGHLRQNHTQKIQQANEAAVQRHDATAKMEMLFKQRLNVDWLVPTAPIITPVDDLKEPDEPETDEFPAFNAEQTAVINGALRGSSDTEPLITKFGYTIRRSDIQTLTGLNWLNDEVINFYMSLLTERSELRSAEGLPKVYAFNTFFLSRLFASGYAGVRRWTRRVDIFAYDIIPVPVHVGGVHWCMAIIDFRRRTIRYYDSMISKNPNVLQKLADYLVEEGRDKKGTPFDLSGWQLESMCDIPRQNNQCDCGVFSCAFAETLTRDAPVRFSQQNMPWIRMKMVLEICSGKMIL